MEEGPSVPIEQPQDSEGEVEICEVETNVLFQAEGLAMEQDEETKDQNKDLGEDSDIDTDKSNDDRNKSDYIPNNIRGSCGHAGVSCKHAGVSNVSETFMGKQGTKERHLAYKFCPLPHWPSILRLLTKHFCQHPFSQNGMANLRLQSISIATLCMKCTSTAKTTTSVKFGLTSGQAGIPLTNGSFGHNRHIPTPSHGREQPW